MNLKGKLVGNRKLGAFCTKGFVGFNVRIFSIHDGSIVMGMHLVYEPIHSNMIMTLYKINL